VVCGEREQGVFRTILLRHVNAHAKMTIKVISTQDGDQPGRATVVADIYATERNDRVMDEVVRHRQMR